MIIKLQPLDTLFFRDGKPFTKGEDDWASTVFPPYPGVIYGALRSMYFASNIEKLSLAGKPLDPTAKLEIKRLYLRLGDDGMERAAFFPMPMDCVRTKGKKKDRYKFYTLGLAKLEDVSSSCPVPYVLLSDRDVEYCEGSHLSFDALNDYLQLKTNFYRARMLDDYVLSEPKTGIGMDYATRATADGRYYRVGMQRLRDIDIGVEFTGLELNPNGLMKLGGEGKAVSYESLDNHGFSINKPNLSGQYIKLYFATPVIFSNGWLPSWLGNDYTGYFGDAKLRLITAALGKPVAIGGFDMKQKKPKPMRRAVPAGSVYYFEIIDGNPGDVVAALHDRCISDFLPEQGYGWCFAGGVLR